MRILDEVTVRIVPVVNSEGYFRLMVKVRVSGKKEFDYGKEMHEDHFEPLFDRVMDEARLRIKKTIAKESF